MIITLIGMPGCGKSCMGRALSSKLKLKNIDGDKLIEKTVGKKLHDIISECGLEEFRRIEEEVLLTINGDDIIISPGGSAVYYESVMEHFKKIGKVVYLYVGLDNLKARLGDYSKRGIVMRPDQTLEDLFLERCALFEKYADITINCDGNSYAKYQRELIARLQSEA